MSRRSRRNPVAVALYINAALLLAILVVLAGRDRSISLTPQAFAQAQPTIAGGAGLFMVPAQFAQNVWGLYLMDVDQQTICAYTVSGSPPTLRLAAARSVRFDRRLGNHNTGSPSPQEVKDLVEKEQSSNRVNDRPVAPAPSPEKPSPEK